MSGTGYIVSINIPASGVTQIANNSFLNHFNLKSVSLPNGLTEIGSSAFNGTGLTSIDIPASITSIGFRAFYNNPSLTTFICRATTPPTLDTSVFSITEGMSEIPNSSPEGLQIKVP